MTTLKRKEKKNTGWVQSKGIPSLNLVDSFFAIMQALKEILGISQRIR
jgi:hypothetical protein